MTYCSACWRPIHPTDRYYGHCGSPVHPPERTHRPARLAAPPPSPHTDAAHAAPIDPGPNKGHDEADASTDAAPRSGIGFARKVLWGLVLLIVVVFALRSIGGGDDQGLSQPRPGSAADMMCDTNSVGDPGIVRRGTKYYDEDCLDVYSWTDPLGG